MTPDEPQTRMTDAWLKEYRGLAENALRLGWRIQLSGRELTALLDAYEARTRSVEPPPEFSQLMTFYSVTTIAGLIEAQDYHIKCLQEKLPQRVDQFPGSPRRG